MMRVLAGVLAVALVAAACGDGEDSERPKESARPELTAEEIAAELDKLFPSVGEETVSYRATVIEQTIRADGTRQETTTEEVVVGENSYTSDRSGIETLNYNGQTYIRKDSSADWQTPEQMGFDFSPLGDYFENLGKEFESTPDEFFKNTDGERLPDQSLDGRHALVISANLDEFLEVFLRGLERTLEGLPAETPNAAEEQIPHRQTGKMEFWLDAVTFEPLRMRIEVISYQDGQETERSVIETTYSDFNDVEELPVDLPGAQTN